MFEIKITLTADQVLQALIQKFCTTLDNQSKRAAFPTAKSAATTPTAPAAAATGTPAAQTAAPAAPAQAPQAQPAPVPTAAAPAYKLEDLQAAVGPLLMQGKGPQLQGLLKKYGVQRLPDLPDDKRGLFAADIRGLGAQI